jgi:hypothetical protein
MPGQIVVSSKAQFWMHKRLGCQHYTIVKPDSQGFSLQPGVETSFAALRMNFVHSDFDLLLISAARGLDVNRQEHTAPDLQLGVGDVNSQERRAPDLQL